MSRPGRAPNRTQRHFVVNRVDSPQFSVWTRARPVAEKRRASRGLPASFGLPACTSVGHTPCSVGARGAPCGTSLAGPAFSPNINAMLGQRLFGFGTSKNAAACRDSPATVPRRRPHDTSSRLLSAPEVGSYRHTLENVGASQDQMLGSRSYSSFWVLALALFSEGRVFRFLGLNDRSRIFASRRSSALSSWAFAHARPGPIGSEGRAASRTVSCSASSSARRRRSVRNTSAIAHFTCRAVGR